MSRLRRSDIHARVEEARAAHMLTWPTPYEEELPGPASHVVRIEIVDGVTPVAGLSWSKCSARAGLCELEAEDLERLAALRRYVDAWNRNEADWPPSKP